MRVTAFEGRLAIVATEMAAMWVRIDRMDRRIERIECRLDLAGAA